MRKTSQNGCAWEWCLKAAQLLQQLSIKENIALPLRLSSPESGSARGRAHAGVDGTEIPGRLGAGCRQPELAKTRRIGACADVAAEVLLLDNPLAGLDLRHLRWWIDFLKELSTGHECAGGRPMTIVVTTDDLRHWRQMDAHFAMLQDKHLIPLGRQKIWPPILNRW